MMGPCFSAFPEADDAVSAINWDENGLVPAIVQDAQTGQFLMLAYMNKEALVRCLSTGDEGVMKMTSASGLSRSSLI